MLYTKDFLMLHYPKTAGTSASVYFCKNFPKPIFGCVSPGLIDQLGMSETDDVHLLSDGDHWNFQITRDHLASKGLDIAAFKALILPIRNPYDLVVSHYNFLKQAYERTPALRDRPAFKLAAESTFTEFCEKNRMIELANFLPPDELKDQLPVEIIKFEDMRGAFSRLLAKYGIREIYELPHLNRSDRPKSYADAYDAQSKAFVDEKMDTMFRLGGYEKSL